MAYSSLLICTATEFESALLRAELAADRRVQFVRMGVGPVNAAHAVTWAVAQHKPDGIVVCGVGGAYLSSGLQVGDVVSAQVEIYGDLGAHSPDGFLDMSALGFAVVDDVSPALFNELPMQLFPVERRANFVTVSACSGIETDARELETRTKGAVENMEGAAVAHVAHLHRIPVGEVRGISNMATTRDKRSWRLKEAAEVSQRALLEWLSTELG